MCKPTMRDVHTLLEVTHIGRLLDFTLCEFEMTDTDTLVEVTPIDSLLDFTKYVNLRWRY